MRDLPHIRYLYVVKEIFQHRRISIAASIVHISQPAASQSLARVEDYLKNRLFERHPKGLDPTEIGLIFERRLSRVLHHLRRGDSLACKKANRGKNGKPKTLPFLSLVNNFLSVSSFVCRGFLTGIISALVKARAPNW